MSHRSEIPGFHDCSEREMDPTAAEYGSAGGEAQNSP